ncbi:MULTISPECIES: MobF family relaxase [unclassified Pseudonocardia]|uniref:MobF family relaxase n=1 Tax=unclassified Pseudonocardia TaxID=2619320 RepID=UPI00030B2F9A|nr:MobF family relaxase [Pseudonocardia sp. Ae707_Ps1]OLM09054.1 putative TraA-like conjugal transfer protein [Pseudonocardia sp. Ae707_Ps1]
MLRINTVGAGAVEYLLRGSGCAAQARDNAGPDRSLDAGQGADGPGYYATAVERGEPEGRWFGSGMQPLGLRFTSGEVVLADDVRAVFGQLRRPDSTEDDPVYLGNKPRKYLSPEERAQRAIDREPGAPTEERIEEIRRAAESDTRRSVAYYDWTFSAPKSVSVYYTALISAGALEEAARVRRAHDEAVETAVSFADARVAVTRTGRHFGPRSRAGMGTFEQGRGTTWTLWGHSTNREDEPQLHTHAALLNRTATADGRITALDGASFRGIKQAVDAVYQQALEQLVTEASGVGWRDRADGHAREIAGIDQGLMDAASTRTEQVDARVKALVEEFRARTGRAPSAAAMHRIARMAVLDTRGPKSADAGPQALQRWARAHANELRASLSDASEAAATRPSAGAESGEQVDRDELLRAAVERVAGRYAVWDVGNLTLAIKAEIGDRWVGLGWGEATPAQRAAALEELAQEAVGRADVVRVSMAEPVEVPAELRRGGDTAAVSDGGYVLRGAHRERYTSAANLGREEAVVARVCAPLEVGLAAGRVAAVREELVGQGMSHDQVDAVTAILSSHVAGDVLVGPAGAGKSRTVGALADVWTREIGGRVLGLATSQVAAENLRGDGIPALNTTVFEKRYTPDGDGRVRQHLQRGDLLVVDEAGMSSTADLHLITRLAGEAGAKVVLSGDHEQLSAIDAGGLFEHLTRHAASIAELALVHRFEESWERAASLLVRAGDTAAVAEYMARGRLRAGTLEQMQNQAGEAWLADTLAGKRSLLIVGTNEHAADLSDTLRSELIRLGRVEQRSQGRIQGGQLVSVGDRVQARRNDRRLRVEAATRSDGRPGTVQPVTNREVYTIVGATDDGTLLGRDRHGAIAHFPTDYAEEHLTLAYAVTVHASQSLTVDTGHFLADEGSSRESAYPGITRGRESNHVWMVSQRDADEHNPQALRETARSRFSEIVEYSGAQRSALATREEGERRARSLVTLAGDWFDLAQARSRERAGPLLERALGATTARRVEREHGRGSLLTVLAEAELGGHDPETVLREAVHRRELGSAENVSDVLRWRIARALPRRVPDDPSAAQRFPAWTVNGDDARARQQNRLAPLIGARARQLGENAADEQAQWAVEHLGPIPEVEHEPEAHESWVQRAGEAAGYREYTGIPAESTTLGPAPAAEDVHARAWWTRAVVALGGESAMPRHHSLSDAELAETIRTWERTRMSAPVYAADALGAAHTRLHEAQVSAVLSGAQRDNPRAEEHEREQSWSRAEELEATVRIARADVADWSAAHTRRAEWFAGVRDVADDARLAAEELRRRGRDWRIDPEPEQFCQHRGPNYGSEPPSKSEGDATIAERGRGPRTPGNAEAETSTGFDMTTRGTPAEDPREALRRARQASRARSGQQADTARREAVRRAAQTRSEEAARRARHDRHRDGSQGQEQGFGPE